MTLAPADRSLLVLISRGDYVALHLGLSAALAAASEERPVDVVLFWWALHRLARGDLDEPHFPGFEEVAERFAQRGMPTCRTLLGLLRQTGRLRLYACTGSMSALGLTAEGMNERVDGFLGWNAILQLSTRASDRLSL